MIIAIDGPAASGKSTLARALADRLGAVFLDTGAMYRAVTLEVQRRGVDPADGEACALVARELELAFDERGRVRIDGRPGEPAIRGVEVTRDVSLVSRHPGVRAAIVPLQRAIAERAPHGIVAEGRDTTTVVFPAADHKLFLIASSQERARRRARELGRPAEAAAIRAELDRRDAFDATRADSPLRQAPDAVRVETDGLGADEVLALVLSIVRGGHAPASGSSAERDAAEDPRIPGRGRAARERGEA